MLGSRPRAVDGDASIVDSQLTALAKKRFGPDDERALPQIVRARLEADAEEPDTLPAGLDDAIDRVLDLQAVAPEVSPTRASRWPAPARRVGVGWLT